MHLSCSLLLLLNLESLGNPGGLWGVVSDMASMTSVKDVANFPRTFSPVANPGLPAPIHTFSAP